MSMVRSLSLFFYRLKWAFRLLMDSYMLAVAGLAVIAAAICLNLPDFQTGADARTVMIAYVFFMPLLTIAVFAALFAQDLNSGILAHHYSYPRPQWLVFGERALMGALLMAAYQGGLLWAVHQWTIPLSQQELGEIIWHSSAVNVFGAGLAALGSLLGRNMAIGLALGGCLWLVEFCFANIAVHRYYLFQAIWPMSNIADADEHSLIIALAGAALLAGSMLALAKGNRWLVRKA